MEGKMRNHKAPQDSISPLGSGPSDREVFGWVRARSRRYRRTIVSLFLLSLIGLVPSTLSPFLIRRFINGLTHGEFLTSLALLTLALSIAAVAFTTYQRYLVQVTQREGARDLAGEVYTHVQGLPFSFMKSTSTGELMSRILNDTNILGQQCVMYYPMLIINLLHVVAGVIVLSLLEWKLAVIACTYFPVAWFLVRRFNWKQRKGWEAAGKNRAHQTESLREKLEGMPIIKGYARKGFFNQLFLQDLENFFRSLRRALLYEQLSNGVLTQMVQTLAIFLLILGAFLAFTGHTSLGAVIAFFWYVGNLYAPIAGLADWNNARQQVLPMGRRVLSLLAVESEEEREGLPMPSLPSISLVGVSAGYNTNEVLHSINLEFECGKLNAVVGESGSGKSTLISLLLGFNERTQGKILINGLPVEHYGTKELREGITFVRSEAFLFNFSIRDNITLGEKYTTEEVIWAAKVAQIHDFIMELPDKYETVAGERGGRFSDGQRQRIALARALIRRPKILILDEATSGVDSKTEAKIYESLQTLGMNLIVVAHRLSTIYTADQINVLADGHLVCQGTHMELMERCPAYRTLFEKQLSEDKKATGLSTGNKQD